MWDLIFYDINLLNFLKNFYEYVCLWNFMCTMCVQVPKEVKEHQTSWHQSYRQL